MAAQKKKKDVVKVIATIIALFCVVALVGGVYFITKGQNETVNVLSYSTNITGSQAKHEITAADLTTTKVLVTSVTKDMVIEQNASKVIGKYLTADVTTGQYVSMNYITEKNDKSVNEVIESNDSITSYIAIPVSYETAALGAIKAGDYVDILYVGSDTVSEQTKTYGKIVMQNVLVYSVNTADAYLYTDHSNTSSSSDDSAIGLVTVAVSRTQALELTTRMAQGRLSLIGQFTDGTLVEDVNAFIINDLGGYYLDDLGSLKYDPSYVPPVSNGSVSYDENGQAVNN